MFAGRKKELEKLESLYRGGIFECAVIYGRRRVGKTTIINEFIQGKKAIFFTAAETTGEENLAALSRSILALSLGMETGNPLYPNFETALDAVYELSKKERIIFIIDEYPYLAASYRGFSSILQKQIDHKYKGSRLMLILCGSSMSFMENQVLGYQSPLFGRRTAQFKINHFTWAETREFFDKTDGRFTAEETALAYGISGGIPLYLSLLREKSSIPENIKKNFLDPNAYLFEEPQNLLKQEVREAAVYNGIIRVIAEGSSRLSDIAAKTHIVSSAAAVYLNNLISLGIVVKETPVSGNQNKTIYRIADSMFRFWYRFIPANLGLIQSGMADHALALITPQLPAFMGPVFEEICKEWLWQKNAARKLPITFTAAGRWWGNDPVHKKEAEVDILCPSADDDAAIICECKWTHTLVDVSILETLIARSEIFAYPKKYLYLFAKKGFTQGCKKLVEKTGATLVTFADMWG
jgi:AAA+ ATPase superfamily predicted ATPase